MLGVRAGLAVGMIVVGAVIFVRMIAQGFRVEILPGAVLGIALIALGVHRLSLIFRARGATR